MNIDDTRTLIIIKKISSMSDFSLANIRSNCSKISVSNNILKLFLRKNIYRQTTFASYIFVKILIRYIKINGKIL